MPEITLKDLPLMMPPRSAWPALEQALRTSATAKRRTRPVAWAAWAAAAALAVAVLLPRWSSAPLPATRPAVATLTPPAADELQRLQQESARLEGLLAWSRNDAVAIGSIDSLAEGLELRVAAIDGLLAQDALDPQAALPLWQERVLRLRQWLDLQTTQQLLAANGDADPGAPVLAF